MLRPQRQSLIQARQPIDRIVLRTVRHQIVLLAGQRRDGGFGVHPYRKWTGAHWRLVSLVELEVPPEIQKAWDERGDPIVKYPHPALFQVARPIAKPGAR